MTAQKTLAAHTPGRAAQEGATSRESNGRSWDGSNSEQSFLEMQKAIGNRATRDVLSVGLLQPKLRIGAPNDRFEREDDRTAEAVIRMPAPPENGKASAEIGQASRVQAQRMCEECEEEEEGLRRQPLEEEVVQPKAKPGLSHRPPGAGVESLVASLRGGGRALHPAERSFFEPRFGHDFSNVRVHTGGIAAAAAQSIHARAFTLGRDVVFGAGEYAPESASGRRLLAHELTHVVQQTPGVGQPPGRRPTSFHVHVPPVDPADVARLVETLRQVIVSTVRRTTP